MNNGTLYYGGPLAEAGGQLLSTNNGEVLYVYYSGVINMKLLQDKLKKSTIKPRFRLFVLNSDETINYEIPKEDIKLESGSFTENYQSGQRKNLNIDLINSEGKYNPGINSLWVNNRFRFDIGIEDGDLVYWFPRGIYILGDPSSSHDLSVKEVSLPLVDKFAVLEGPMGTLEATYEIPKGADIKEAIQGILTLDNGSGFPIDLKPIIYDHIFEGAKMPYALKKDAGSTLGEMLIDIGTILNAEVFYNSLGNLCVISINETIDDTGKQVLWYYTENEKEYQNASVAYDFSNVINEVQVVGDYVNNGLSYAFVQNNNPLSSICIQRIGRRIKYINDENIYSDLLAADRAKYELRKNTILNTSISIRVSFNPLLFVNNLITIDDSFYGYQRTKFLIQGISYSFGTDTKMSISCSNIQNFLLMEDIKTTSFRTLTIEDDLSSQTLYFNFPNNFTPTLQNAQMTTTGGSIVGSIVDTTIKVLINDGTSSTTIFNSAVSGAQLLNSYKCSANMGKVTEISSDSASSQYFKYILIKTNG